MARPAPRLLIVDDSEPLRSRVCAMLRDHLPGVAVGEAATPDAAILEVQRADFDVVLLDLRLPGGDGLQVLRAIRELRPTQRVIVLSSLPEIPYEAVARRLGAMGYVSKERLPGDLLRVLALALDDAATT